MCIAMIVWCEAQCAVGERKAEGAAHTRGTKVLDERCLRNIAGGHLVCCGLSRVSNMCKKLAIRRADGRKQCLC